MRTIAQALEQEGEFVHLHGNAEYRKYFALLTRAIEPAIAEQTYNYYVGELQPFPRKLAVPDQIISGTVKTLIELGDIKPESATARYVDLSYLPR